MASVSRRGEPAAHPDDCWRRRGALLWCWASPTMRGVSTAGERAVGQRPDYRSQRPGVFDRHVTLVKVHQGVAYDDRAAVSGSEQLGEVGVVSAAGPAATSRLWGTRLSRPQSNPRARRRSLTVAFMFYGTGWCMCVIAWLQSQFGRRYSRALLRRFWWCRPLAQIFWFQIDTRPAGYTAGRLSRARQASAFIS